jgi:hypothetical protein
MLSRIVAITVLFASTQALAFDTTKLGQLGSVALDMDEMLAVIAQSPKLKTEIDQAITAVNKKPGDIMCDGMRFPSAWKELAGVRVSPYRCQIGDKWLKINTKVTITGKRKKVYEAINAKAMREAEDVKETDPTWTWSNEKPPQP